MHEWDAGQYLRFAGERTRPAADLVARCYATLLADAYPERSDGRIMLPPRLFFIATPQ